jgi:hypothetical protein
MCVGKIVNNGNVTKAGRRNCYKLVWVTMPLGPGAFSWLPWRRTALLGLESRSCCMSFGRTLNAALRSPFNFWHAAIESALALPEFCRMEDNE